MRYCMEKRHFCEQPSVQIVHDCKQNAIDKVSMQLVLDNRIYKTALFAFRQGKDTFANNPTYIYVRDCKQKCL